MKAFLSLCFCAAIVISSSYPIDLDDLPGEYEIVELPNSDISKRSLHEDLDMSLTGVEKISKRSLRTDFGTPLTGMEKISKRSLKTDDGFLLTGVEKISKRSADQDESGRQRRYVFLPSFAKRRQGRSIEFETDVLDSNDVFKREKRQLFLPSFGHKRVARSVFLPGFAKRRNGRSISDDDMETAESAVFLPAFRRSG